MQQTKALEEINLERTYHIVFSTYYRFPTLIQAPHRQTVSQWIKSICEEKKITLIIHKILSDHVHLLITKQKGQSLPVIIQSIKGISTYWFFQEFPEMKREIGKARLWNRGYNETLIQSAEQLRNTILYINNNFDKYLGSPRV